MSADFVRPFKREEGCLSGWQLSQLVVGILPAAQRGSVESHLARCSACAEKLAQEQAAARAAALERVPAALLALRPAPRARKLASWSALVSFAAIAATLLLVLLPSARIGERGRLKGSFDLEAAVLRQGALLVPQAGLEHLPLLEAGDRLRLRVVGATEQAVFLEGREGGRWVVYYRGPLPEDRWLPVGVTVTSEPGTSLRLSLCFEDVRDVEAALASRRCRTRVWELPTSLHGRERE